MTNNNVLKFINLTEHKAKKILQEVTQDSCNIKFSIHALKRMKERGISRPQIIPILNR